MTLMRIWLVFGSLGAVCAAQSSQFGWELDRAKGVIALRTGGASFTISRSRPRSIRVEGAAAAIWFNGRRNRGETFYLHQLKSAAASVDAADHKEVKALYTVADDDGVVVDGVEVELRAGISIGLGQLHIRSILRNVSGETWPHAIAIWHFETDSPNYFTPGPIEWTYEGSWKRVLGKPAWLYLPSSAGGMAVFSQTTLREGGGGPGRTSISGHERYISVPPGGEVKSEFTIMPAKDTEEAAAAYIARLFPSPAAVQMLRAIEARPFKPAAMADVIPAREAGDGFRFELDRAQSAITLETCGTIYRVQPRRATMLTVSGSGVKALTNCRMSRDEVLYAKRLKDVRVDVDEPGRKRLTAVYAVAARQGAEKTDCELELGLEITDASNTLALDVAFRNLSDRDWPQSILLWHFMSDQRSYFTPGPRTWSYEGKWRTKAGQQAWLYVPHSDGGLGVLTDVSIGEGGARKAMQLSVSGGYGPTPARGAIEQHYVILPARRIEDVMAACLRQAGGMRLDRAAYLKDESVRIARLRLPAAAAGRSQSVHAILAAADGRRVSEWSCKLDSVQQQAFATGGLAEGDYVVAVEMLDRAGVCTAAAVERFRVANEEHDAVRTEIASAKARLAALAGSRLATGAMLDEVQSQLAGIEGCLHARKYANARRRAKRLALWTGRIESGREKYFSDVAQRLTRIEAAERPLVTISWRPGPQGIPRAIEWAKRLRATEICFMGKPSAAELKEVRAAGLRTAALFKALVADKDWSKRRPEHRQVAYFVTPAVKAAAKGVTIPIPAKQVGWGGTVEVRSAKRWWRVEDADSGARLSPRDWEIDVKNRVVRVRNTVAGHEYRLYYTIEHYRCDPVYPEFRQHALAKLEAYFKTLDRGLQTFFTDDTAYAWLGHMPGGGYEWDSYHFGSSKGMQAEFERAANAKFDPAMLVGTDIAQSPRLPRELNTADNRPPSDALLAHRAVVQRVTNEWAKLVTDMCRRHGVELWHYWGDAHVGVEPYLAGLEAGGIAHIDKPCWGSAACATIMRTLTDFPGPAKRRTRLLWMTNTLNRAEPARDLMRYWTEAKRALLFKMIDGLYWMPFEAVPEVADPLMRQDVLDAIGKIDDEFTFLHAKLQRRRAFTHDLTLYVVNAWGRVYSWHPWPNRKGLPVFLEDLTDLPIRVKFISLRELAKRVPEDANVLLNYGAPGTSWNGGYTWTLPGVVDNIEKFVAAGGGLIGVGAPAHFDTGKITWHLRQVLGVECDGAQKPTIEAKATALAKKHWITKSMPDRFDFAQGWTAKPTTRDLQILFADAEKPEGTPAVAVRQPGKGRACYINGYSTGPRYYQLLRRAIFWCARREADLPRLYSDTSGIFTYLYPELKTLIVYNASGERAAARVTFDVSLLGTSPTGKIELRDALTGETVYSGPGLQLRQGLALPVAPGAARFLEVRPMPG